MSKRLRIVTIALGIIAVLAVAAGIYYKSKFPYGHSHCCIIGIAGALEQYASENSGRYPAGESSPEASLSLLCRSNYLDAYTIRGMIVPERTVRAILDKGGLLGPDTCGWHYTDGLTRADDSRIALLYCKEPLGHNGDKTKNGGRQVFLLVEASSGFLATNGHPSLKNKKNCSQSERTERKQAYRLLTQSSNFRMAAI